MKQRKQDPKHKISLSPSLSFFLSFRHFLPFVEDTLCTLSSKSFPFPIGPGLLCGDETRRTTTTLARTTTPMMMTTTTLAAFVANAPRCPMMMRRRRRPLFSLSPSRQNHRRRRRRRPIDDDALDGRRNKAVALDEDDEYVDLDELFDDDRPSNRKTLFDLTPALTEKKGNLKRGRTLR